VKEGQRQKVGGWGCKLKNGEGGGEGGRRGGGAGYLAPGRLGA